MLRKLYPREYYTSTYIINFDISSNISSLARQQSPTVYY